MAKSGIFLTFEGGEGCGKSTQIHLLAETLQNAGADVLLTREPGGTSVGEQIRHVLQYSRDSSAMVAEAELLLFAASRAQLVREIIVPALENGKVVISDRFLDSTSVYQGVARKISEREVQEINRFATGGFTPHLTFILDLDVAKARERMQMRPESERRPDRMEEQPIDFYEEVRRGYLELGRREPERCRILAADVAPEKLAGQIRDILKEKFHGLFG